MGVLVGTYRSDRACVTRDPGTDCRFRNRNLVTRQNGLVSVLVTAYQHRMEFDDDILEIAVNRRSVLAVLAREPHDRRALEESLAVSKATCHRIVRSFEEWGLIRRTDRGYELTEVGAEVAAQLEAFERNIETAYRLTPLLEAFESAGVDFDVELFTDATVTRPEPDDPSPPVHRYLELFQEAESVRTIARTSFVPHCTSRRSSTRRSRQTRKGGS